MGVKTNGETIKRYLGDTSLQAWPKDTYYEEDEILINGVLADMDTDLSVVADDAIIEIKGGAVLMEGDQEKCVAMTTHFRRWLKKQSHVTLLVEVHRDYVDAMRNAVEAHGGKVIS
jgi:class 3 adenylate cyclase